MASESTRVPSSPARSCASSSWAPSVEVEDEPEHYPTPLKKAAAERPSPDAQAELHEYLEKSVQEKVDHLMAEITARRTARTPTPEVDDEQEHDPAPQAKTTAERPPPDPQTELGEYMKRYTASWYG